MSKISVFERPLAMLDLGNMKDISAFGIYPWGNEAPLNFDEVSQAITEGRLIEPGVFSDEPEGDERHNIDECSRNEHIQRIAWFAKNFDSKVSPEIEIDIVGVSESAEKESVEFSFAFSGGNHRLSAMIFNGVRDYPVRLNNGNKKSIESNPAFKNWIEAPSHDGMFGYNILSSEQETWEVDARNEPHAKRRRIWVSDVSHMGMSIARLNINEAASSYEIEDKNGERFCHFTRGDDGKEPVTIETFLSKCAEHISSLFADERLALEVAQRLNKIAA
ncbi:hypothetical protein [Aeromonas media]|uniref:hypothetical protein n=1 Tax=Aeromonas media TaxID=651 RepID=UPI003D242901